MIGNEYEYILTQNDLFSRGSFLCHRAELALKCLQSADKNEGNHPFLYYLTKIQLFQEVAYSE